MNSCIEYETYTVDIHFEKGYDNCQHCPLLETYSRNMCRLSGEYIGDTRGKGLWCKLRKDGVISGIAFQDAESE